MHLCGFVPLSLSVSVFARLSEPVCLCACVSV